MNLTDSEKQTALWLKIKQEIESDLATYRLQNDGDLTPEKTQRTRGRIAQCKRMLAWENPTPVVTDDN